MNIAGIKVFDGHNDLLLRLWHKKDSDPVRDFLDGDGKGHMDLPRMARGGMGGGMFAIFMPSPGEDLPPDDEDMNPPMAAEVPHNRSLPVALQMAAILFRIERESAGRFKVCRTAGEIRDCLRDGITAAVFHIEGAECIDADLAALEVLYHAGLRSIGPVWSRPNIFGHGVPFRFPSSPDTGPGLTGAGKEFVRACNRLKVVVDLSHLNEKGFWDVAEISDAPLIATHSNAHALSASSRNLTDRQLKAIGETGGMVGLNFANGFLRADGRWQSPNGLDDMLRHLDHMIALAGEDHIGFGSDFEGARIPAGVGDVTGLPRLLTTLADHGYGEALIRKIAHENWISALARSWGG
jgi:membrane dipeptidase